jgi:hypothetical protein
MVSFKWWDRVKNPGDKHAIARGGSQSMRGNQDFAGHMNDAIAGANVGGGAAHVSAGWSSPSPQAARNTSDEGVATFFNQ